MTALSFSFSRAGLIASHTVRMAVRQRAPAILTVLAAALVVGATGLRDFNFGASELKFVADLGFGAMTVFGSVLTIMATTQLLLAEIEQRTALTLLAKPLRRSEFVVGKFLGVLVLAAAFCLVLTALLAAMLWSREYALSAALGTSLRLVSYAAVGVVGFTLWLKLTVLAALTLLIATFARSQLYAATLGFLVLVICHLQYLAQEAAGRAATFTARIAAGALSLLFPNFQVFNFAEALGGGVPLAWGDVARVTAYAFGYAAAVCALAAWSFRQREI